MITQRRLSISWPGSQFGEQSFLENNAIDWLDVPPHRAVDREFALKSLFPGHFGLSKRPLYVKNFTETLAGNRTKMIALSTNLCPRALTDRPPIRESKTISSGLNWLGLENFSVHEIDALTGLAFRFLFQFNSKLITEVDRAREVLGLNKWERYAAVHIRSGFVGVPGVSDQHGHPKLTPHTGDWLRTLHCAVKVSDELLGNSSLLFLATDSFLVKQFAVEKFGSRIRTLNNSLIHTDFLQKYPHSPSADEVEGVLTLWVEFILLAESSVQIRGASGLPAIAGHVCSIPSSRVFNGIHCTSEKNKPTGCAGN